MDPKIKLRQGTRASRAVGWPLRMSRPYATLLRSSHQTLPARSWFDEAPSTGSDRLGLLRRIVPAQTSATPIGIIVKTGKVRKKFRLLALRRPVAKLRWKIGIARDFRRAGPSQLGYRELPLENDRVRIPYAFSGPPRFAHLPAVRQRGDGWLLSAAGTGPSADSSTCGESCRKGSGDSGPGCRNTGSACPGVSRRSCRVPRPGPGHAAG